MGGGTKDCEVDGESGMMSWERQGYAPFAPGACTIRMCLFDGRSLGLNPVAPLENFSSHEGGNEWKKEEGTVSILSSKSTRVAMQAIMRKAA